MFWNKKFKILKKSKFQLPGLITKCALNSDGLLYAIIINKNLDYYYDQYLYGISLDNGIAWKFEKKLGYPNELRVDEGGSAWVSYGNNILQINDKGSEESSIELSLNKKQEIGSIVLLKKGILVAIQAKGENKPDAKVLRIDFSGKLIWKTEILPGYIEHPGVVEMKASNNWKVEKVREWKPENWLIHISNTIIVSHRNVLVTYFEMPRSGIGISYCLDLISGKMKWTTQPTPFGSISCFDDGRFLIQKYGYGAFDADLYNSEGKIIDSWKRIGPSIINKKGEIYLIEIENYLKSPTHAFKLLNNEELLKGESISGYHMSHPLIDENGNIVFWRNGCLQVLDSSLKKYTLMKKKESDNAFSIPDRILMVREGELVFNLEDKIYKLQTNLGRLANSSWACRYSNMQRNPVVNEYLGE